MSPTESSEAESCNFDDTADRIWREGISRVTMNNWEDAERFVMVLCIVPNR